MQTHDFSLAPAEAEVGAVAKADQYELLWLETTKTKTTKNSVELEASLAPAEVMQSHAKLCKVMQRYAKSCKLCKVMQSYAKSCKVMQSYAKLCKLMTFSLFTQLALQGRGAV